MPNKQQITKLPAHIQEMYNEIQQIISEQVSRINPNGTPDLQLKFLEIEKLKLQLMESIYKFLYDVRVQEYF